MDRTFPTKEEWTAFYHGREDGGNEAKERPFSFVVVFEESTSQEERAATSALLKRIRGVEGVFPVIETHHGHLQWRELLDALGADPCDEHSHDFAMKLARTAGADADKAALAWDAFFKMATLEQQRVILAEIYPLIGKTT